MPRKLILMLCAWALCAALGQTARAQGDEDGGRVEVGGHFTTLRVRGGISFIDSNCFTTPCPPSEAFTLEQHNEFGFGGRAGYRLNRFLTVEAEVNYFPRERAPGDDEFTGGRKVQGLFGVKVGKRFEHVGVFAKARPGFVRFEQGDLVEEGPCPAVFPQPLGCFEPRGRTDFALDLGGVVELYPSRHTFIRFDAGDTILRSDAHTAPALHQLSPSFPVAPVGIPVSGGTTHNFQAGVGFGFRF